MPDRLFFSLMTLAAVARIALAGGRPQVLGACAPGPFGQPTAAQLDGPAAPHPGKAAQLKGTW